MLTWLTFRSELRPTLRLALPLVLAEIGWMSMAIVDTMMVGRLPDSARSIAAVSISSNIFHVMAFFGEGILIGLDTLVSQSFGAGRREDADALLFHAIVLAVIFGGMFTLCTVLGGPALYRTLGGRGDALEAAVTYSNYLFAGAIPVWIVNLQAAALRGSGNVRVPALVTLVGAIVTIELCGSVDHAGGCRWPHNSTVVELDGTDAVFRSVFVAPPAEAEEVHDRIASALRSSAEWVVLSEGERPLSDDEAALGVRLARTSPPSG